VAESVEDLKTLEILKGFGVDMVQGYYLETPHSDLVVEENALRDSQMVKKHGH